MEGKGGGCSISSCIIFIFSRLEEGGGEPKLPKEEEAGGGAE